jgi:hypothetical protein
VVIPVVVAGALLVWWAVAEEFKGAPAQSSPHSPAASNEPARFEITGACKKAVLHRLKAPGSADFQGMLDDVPDPTKQADGSYLWRSWVDSQNSFGAKLRTRFMCEFANGVATVTMER